MKIAIPENAGDVNQHFGQSRSFAIIEIDENKKVTGVETVSTVGLEHQHAGIAKFLKGQGVETVIVGGIGPGAIEGLEAQGLNILFGAAGTIKEVAETYANGEFVSDKKVCGHHHGDHHGHHHHENN